MNNFTAMTEERRQELVADCKISISNLKEALRCAEINGWEQTAAESMSRLLRQEIALAALTAEPDHYVFHHPAGKLLNHLASDECKGQEHVVAGYTAPPAPVLRVQELTVWYGAMPETNGKSNWTAILHRKGECISTGITIDRSEYPDRVRYEADRMRYLIGELDIKPSILSYDGSKHSGYVQPVPPAPVLRVAIDFSALDRLAGKFLQASVERGGRVSSAYAEFAHLLATEVKLLRAAGYEVK